MGCRSVLEWLHQEPEPTQRVSGVHNVRVVGHHVAVAYATASSQTCQCEDKVRIDASLLDFREFNATYVGLSRSIHLKMKVKFNCKNQPNSNESSQE